MNITKPCRTPKLQDWTWTFRTGQKVLPLQSTALGAGSPQVWSEPGMVLYTSGGVLMWQSIVGMHRARAGPRGGAWIWGVARGRGICIEGVHGTNGAGHHEWHVIGRSSQCQRVIRRASKWLQVQLSPLLLYPQRHELLLQVVAHSNGCRRNRGTSSATLGRKAAVAASLLQQHHLVAFVAFVVERRKGQDIQEEQRRPDRHSHTQLRGVIPSGLWKWRQARPLRTFRIHICIRWVRGGHRGLACAGMIRIQHRVFPSRSVWESAGWRRAGCPGGAVE